MNIKLPPFVVDCRNQSLRPGLLHFYEIISFFCALRNVIRIISGFLWAATLNSTLF